MSFSRYSVILLSRWGRHFASVPRNANNNNNNIQNFEILYHPVFNFSRVYSTLRKEYGSERIEPFGNVEGKTDKVDFDLPIIYPSSISQLNNSEDDFESIDKLIDVKEKRPGPLDTCTEDLSHIGNTFSPSFNFAAYADKSETIRKLFELGVDFSKIEKRKGLAKFLMPLDFERDMKLHIRFLNDCGVPPEQLGEFLTKNPLIFKEDLDDLHTRIRYLGAHKFSPAMIMRIVTKNPYWVMFSTKRIDTRLGHFQREFQLSGKEIRMLATKQPRLITSRMSDVVANTFAVREEMGFDKLETKQILLKKPRIWMKSEYEIDFDSVFKIPNFQISLIYDLQIHFSGRSHVVECFDYAHNIMKLPHSLISEQPEILTCRLHRLKQRHMFLETQGRAQYDPKKPMYVSLKTLVSNSDAEFSIDIAKAPVETYNMFLKTL